jgi:DNA-binding XRE family transcriptional regulator
MTGVRSRVLAPFIFIKGVMRMSKLTPEQELAIEYLSQPGNGGLTITEIADKCGVTRKTIWMWKTKNPRFQEALKTAILANTLHRLPDVLGAMADAAVHDRNAQAAKVLLSANDMLGSKKVEVEMKESATSPEALADLRERLERLTAGRGDA